jgi:inner membrane protein
MAKQHSPGFKLLMAGLVAIALCIPLLMVYLLVYDRENRSSEAQTSIVNSWGAQQVIAGPVLVVPYMEETIETADVNGRTTTRTVQTRRELFVSPQRQEVRTVLDPEKRAIASIYETVVYDSQTNGQARFALPADLSRLGVERESLILDRAELRFGVSDPRGLKDNARVLLDGETLVLQPGNGPGATSGAGFSAFVDWTGAAPLAVEWSFGLRGSQSLALVPRGGETEWQVQSDWPHPGFTGSFLPDSKQVSESGFTAKYEGITNLALGRAIASTSDDGPPMPATMEGEMSYAVPAGPMPEGARAGGPSMAVNIALVDPVNLYSRVDRSVKYGFLFIGFTFVTFLMFDIVGGARVAAAEYLLTGTGLVLFFVLLLALAEIIGFTAAYILASAAIIGLLTAYSAAVLGTWRRAGFIGAMLAGLYALLFVLLSLETWSLLIGAVLLFAALAGVMYATRRVDWSSVGRREDAVAD